MPKKIKKNKIMMTISTMCECLFLFELIMGIYLFIYLFYGCGEEDEVGKELNKKTRGKSIS